MALRIRNWDKHYEVNRTRELKRMEWVPIPNRMDNLGYLRLITHPNGASHFGVWIALVEIASRCDTRGILIMNGSPLGIEDLAFMSRIPADIIEQAILRLREDSIGWIEQFDAVDVKELKQAPAAIPQDAAEKSHAAAVLRARGGDTEYTEYTEEKTNIAAAAEKPQTAVLGSSSNSRYEPFNEPDRERIAEDLVKELHENHRSPGNIHLAKVEVKRLISTADNADKFTCSARASYGRWQKYWDEQKRHNPRCFVPQLHRWFADGDYLHPPGDAAVNGIALKKPPAQMPTPDEVFGRERRRGS